MRCKAPELALSTPRALVVAKSEAPTSYSGRWRELRPPVYVPDVPGSSKDDAQERIPASGHRARSPGSLQLKPVISFTSWDVIDRTLHITRCGYGHMDVIINECEKAVAVKKGKCCEADVPSDLRKEVESHYRLSLPEDFYHFWRFCEGLDPEQPADSLSASLGLRLVGPYDILAGRHKMKKKSASLNFNLHWRFYYDPPEFQTIIVGDCKTEFHMGYFR
ncbi:hypothetical protein EI555_007342 [Monodon monoceros]|uniref:Uncharacterized protein n=1 Tax=Monodon monoceros TaxID=40151 RepID=A0A4U1EKZ8_MONMO|nr:hypothetical protein EI555_007342 [Monodon monoceros]